MKLPFSNPAGVAAARQSAAIRGNSVQADRSAAVCRRAPTACSAFTMVEIALCLAIVGFAMVAIIGVLPAGLNVQKENREDTILNQDSTVWMDAIRSGSLGYDHLTNYVDRIVVSYQNFDATGNAMEGGSKYFVAERSDAAAVNGTVALDNGAAIVGLLSTPRFGAPTINGAAYTTNYVYAYVRAISGNATEKAPQQNVDVRDGAFSYRMVVEVVPEGSFDFAYAGILTNASDYVVRKNLADVRLLCRWPLKEPFRASLPPDRPAVGNSRLTFRTQIGGVIQNYPPGTRLYFVRPGTYTP